VAEAALSWDHRSRFRPPESGLERLQYDAYWVGLDRFLRSEDAIQLVLTFSRTVLDRVAKSEALLQRSNLLPPDLGPQEQEDMAQLCVAPQRWVRCSLACLQAIASAMQDRLYEVGGCGPTSAWSRRNAKGLVGDA